MSNWRCPHCGTPQGEASRCWSCGRSPFACSTCRSFRRAVSTTLGTCTRNRAREVLTGDEVRPCWQSREVAETVPFLGLFGALNPVIPDAPGPEPLAEPEREAVPAVVASPMAVVAPEAVPEALTLDAAPRVSLPGPVPPATITPPTGSAVALAATLTSPVDEESREVWLAAGGTALLSDDPQDVAAVQAAVAADLAGASIDRMIAELLVVAEPAAAPLPGAVPLPGATPLPGAVTPAPPTTAAPPVPPIVALIPPAPPSRSAPPQTPSTGLPATPAPAPQAPVPLSTASLPASPAPAPVASLPQVEPPRPIAIPVEPGRTPLAPPWAGPAGGPLRPPDPHPAPDPAPHSAVPAATPDAGEGPDGRRPPALALLPATLANRFRRGMAGLGWREPAPPLFSASARASRTTPPPGPSVDTRATPAPAPAAPPPIRRYTPPPPPTAVPGRLVEAPWVPPRASSLSLGEQLRRTELARRDRPLADVEGLGGRGGGDAGA